jgi:hypothetical protein
MVIGPRGSGKSTYLQVLSRHLENNLLPSIGGHMYSADPLSNLKLDGIRDALEDGRLPRGSMSSVADATILEPMVLTIGSSPGGRLRSISFFDVAGEDMERPDQVAPYSSAMSGSDVLLFLIDPLQLTGVREWLQGVMPLPLRTIPRPAELVHTVASTIRRRYAMSSGLIPKRVVVAMSKFDALQTLAQIPGAGFSDLIGPGSSVWRDPYTIRPGLYQEQDGNRVHEEIRALLGKLGQTALISAAESSFQQVRFAAFSALGNAPQTDRLSESGVSPHRIGDPIRWLMWGSGWAR